MNTQNELSTVVMQQGLEPSKVETLLQRFSESFQTAKQIASESKDILVTEEDQTELMNQAREKRLELKRIRVDVEKTRVELKEQSLREGRAIDGIANVIKALIVPVEEHLEKQEKFAEIREQARIEKRHSDRISRLSQYVSDVSLYNLKDMEDETFEKLLDQSKKAFEAQKEAERVAEEERKAKVEAERKEQERIKLENEKLKKEAEKREAALAKERAEAAKKIEAERKARELAEKKLADEKRAQEEKERKAREEELAKKKAEEEARVKALLAPDKEKLIKLAQEIDLVKLPAVENKQTNDILIEVSRRMIALSSYIRAEAQKL